MKTSFPKWTEPQVYASLQGMKPDNFSLRPLLNRFEPELPHWLACIPAWLIALTLVALPMLIKTLSDALALPGGLTLPYGPSDPDPWLRLTLVRDWLSGGSWYSHEMLRSNAPFAGIESPWTRPLDVVIALLVKLQFFYEADITLKLQRAAMLLPALWMTALLSGFYYALNQLRAASSTYFILIALIGTMPVMWNYFGMGNADHHALLCALWVWSLAFLLKPQQKLVASRIAGMLLALMLWISPEAFVLILALYAFSGMQWLLLQPVGAHLRALTTSVACGTLVALLIEQPPQQWLTPIYDSLSIVYVFILALIAAWVRVLVHYETKLPRVTDRALMGTIAAGVILTLLWQVYPLAFRGPMAQVDTFIFTHFLPRITEAQPLLSERPMYVIAMVIQPIAAAVVLIAHLRRNEQLFTSRHAFMLLFLLLFTSLLYLTQQRWYYYFYPVVVLILAPWVSALLTPDHANLRAYAPANRLRLMKESDQMRTRAPLLLLIFIAPLVLLVAMPDRTTNATKRVDECAKITRTMIQSGELSAIGKGAALNLLASTDVGGEILFFTPHRIVASNYHREGIGMRYVWEAWKIENLDVLHQHLKQRHIDAILYCPDAAITDESMLRRLAEGKVTAPAWLERVPRKAADPNHTQPVIFLVK